MSQPLNMAPLLEQFNMRGRRRAATLLALGHLFLTLIFATGCSRQPAQPTALPAPEQTWDTFRQGWKKQDLSLILSACAPTPESQDRCRRQFLAVQAAGGFEEMTNALGDLRLHQDAGERRYYIVSVLDRPDEAITVIFRFFSEAGWKILEF